MSSIARAFTLRRKKGDTAGTTATDDAPGIPPLSPKRASSMRVSDKSIDRMKISAPTRLLSTTNMLTYNAPDVSVIQAQRKAASSVSSGSTRRSSDHDSDASSISKRSTQSTDVSSVENSPVSSPQTDNKTSYFDVTLAAKGASTLRRSISTLEIRHQSRVEESSSFPARSESPAIPQRHPSHSKRAHTELAKKRSMQSMSRTNSLSSIMSTQREVRRTSLDFFNGKANDSTSTPIAAPHPFGTELEQLDEIAEEFSGTVDESDKANDLHAMQQRGLARCCADEYLAEIEPLFSSMFGHSNRLNVPAMAWI